MSPARGQTCFVLKILLLHLCGAWRAVDYPHLDSAKCLAAKPALICDPDRILTLSTRAHANNVLRDISLLQECDCMETKYCKNTTRGYTAAMALTRSIESAKRTPVSSNAMEAPALQTPIEDFAKTVRHNWDLEHCSDDMLVIVCIECEQAKGCLHFLLFWVYLFHGDLTRDRKIPEEVHRKMQSQANQLLQFTNQSVVVQYLLINYRKLISNVNDTPTVDMLSLPYADLSSGVVTVMVLTCLLSVGWAVCVTYLLVLIVKRRKERKERHSNKTTSTDLNEETGTGRLGRSPLLDGSNLTRLELRRAPNEQQAVVHWHWRQMRKDPTSSTIAGIPSITSNGTVVGVERGNRRGFSFSACDTRRPNDIQRNGSLPNIEGNNDVQEELMGYLS